MVFCFPLKALITHFFPRGASACSTYGDFCLWSLASDVMVLPPNQSTLKKGHILFWNGSISHLENLYFQNFPDPSEPVCRVDVLHLHPSLPPHSTTNTYFRLHTNGECSNRTPPHGASLCDGSVSVWGGGATLSPPAHIVWHKESSQRFSFTVGFRAAVLTHNAPGLPLKQLCPPSLPRLKEELEPHFFIKGRWNSESSLSASVSHVRAARGLSSAGDLEVWVYTHGKLHQQLIGDRFIFLKVFFTNIKKTVYF